MSDEIEYGYVQIGERRVYVEVLTAALREGLQDDDQEHARALERAGSSVGVMYEPGVGPSLGTYQPASVTRLTKGQFETARDLKWPALLPDEQRAAEMAAAGPEHTIAASGELTMEVKRAST